MIFKNISKTKLSLAFISLVITFFVWQQGLRDSLNRPSVSFDISQKEQEIAELASPSIPANLKKFFITSDPVDQINISLSQVPFYELSERNKLIRIISSESNKPVIEPLIREHLYHSCDVGRQPKKLKKEFNDFDFNNLNDFWWNNNKPINEKKIVKENFNDIKIRLDKFKSLLNTNDSSTIALVSHGTFLSQITGFFLENCERDIWEY